jgi:hypothetical protein
MKANNDIESVEIFAGTIWQAEMAKSLLEDAEIQAFLKDEVNGTMLPWITSAGGAGSVKVVVSSLDSGKAKEIVDKYEYNLSAHL